MAFPGLETKGNTKRNPENKSAKMHSRMCLVNMDENYILMHDTKYEQMKQVHKEL